MEVLIKEKDFLNYRLQRTEQELAAREKKHARAEIESNVDTEHRIRHLIRENDCQRSELIGRGC